MKLSPSAAKRLGIDGTNSIQVKADKGYGKMLCEGVVAAVEVLTSDWQVPVCGVVEYRFHDARRWKFDAAWVEQKVFLELQGHRYHKHRRQMEDDIVKLNEAVRMGWRPVYAMVEHCKKSTAALWVVRLLESAP